VPIRRFILFLAALVMAATPTLAFWEYGHETVARIALDSVRPDTRAKIRALLAQGRLLETPECPVATMTPPEPPSAAISAITSSATAWTWSALGA
jgi:hypothetical protein